MTANYEYQPPLRPFRVLRALFRWIPLILITGSLLGWAQTFLWPGAVSLTWYHGTFELDVELIGERLGVLRTHWTFHATDDQSRMNDKIVWSTEIFRNIEDTSVIPNVVISRYSKVTFVAIELPYVWPLALGVLLEWWRYRRRKRDVFGFPVAHQEGPKVTSTSSIDADGEIVKRETGHS
jgi:hypothetical protein